MKFDIVGYFVSREDYSKNYDFTKSLVDVKQSLDLDLDPGFFVLFTITK